MGVNSDYTDPFSKRIKIIDESADTSFKVNSPVGEYGILVADSTFGSGPNLTDDDGTLADGVKCGLIFYQAGVAVLSGSVFGAATNAATTTFTFDASAFASVNNGTIAITDYAGTTKTYKIKNDYSAVAGNQEFNAGASQNVPAANLVSLINGSDGHNGTITAAAPGSGVVTLTQNSAASTHHLGNTVVTTAASFDSTTSTNASNFSGGGGGNGILATSIGAPQMTSDTYANSFKSLLTGSSISGSADALRHRIYNLQFNNTVELNSSIYFCRINHNEYNYSANPTYLSSSQIRVKSQASDSPVSYVTTVGLYSADNQILAVGKLSEPLRKDPTIEYTLRARLDY